MAKVLTRQELLKELLPGLSKAFADEYSKYAKEHGLGMDVGVIELDHEGIPKKSVWEIEGDDNGF